MGYDTTFLFIEEIGFPIYLEKENNAGLMLKFDKVSFISEPTGVEQVS